MKKREPLLTRLRIVAKIKSDLDRDKELLTEAADAVEDMLDALYQLHAAAMNIEGDALFDSKPSQVAIRQLGEALTVSRAAIAKAEGGHG